MLAKTRTSKGSEWKRKGGQPRTLQKYAITRFTLRTAVEIEHEYAKVLRRADRGGWQGLGKCDCLRSKMEGERKSPLRKAFPLRKGQAAIMKVSGGEMSVVLHYFTGCTYNQCTRV
jgi:hypothetical protein